MYYIIIINYVFIIFFIYVFVCIYSDIFIYHSSHWYFVLVPRAVFICHPNYSYMPCLCLNASELILFNSASYRI